MTKLRIGFSPCPNDTFIFDALIHGKIDTEGLEFEVHMADVEELNQMAFRGELDITKLSYHAFLHILEEYIMMDSGSALGNNCGPLLIKNSGAENPNINDLIAIPGKYTTANFLLNYAFPELQNKKELLFSDIDSAIKNNQVSAGLIIHENRFTYADRGFEKVKDLGEHWEESTGMAIPLGGIAIKRNLDKALQEKVQRLIRKSLEFAFENPAESLGFVHQHAQEMDAEVMQKHINLYVNEYSLSLGEKGKAAIQYMYDFSVEKKLVASTEKNLFV
jgi:1,4-dihydroxy-6-naphthoate synthase